MLKTDEKMENLKLRLKSIDQCQKSGKMYEKKLRNVKIFQKQTQFARIK